MLLVTGSMLNIGFTLTILLTVFTKTFSQLTKPVLTVDTARNLKLDTDRYDVTISGVSNGGAKATEIHVSHSHLFNGFGYFSDGSHEFYRCAGSSKKMLSCNSLEGNTVAKSIEDALEYESMGLIDPVCHLANQKIYILAAPEDTRINDVHFYERFINNTKRILVNKEMGQQFSPTENISASDMKAADQPWRDLSRMTYEMFNFILDSPIKMPSGLVEVGKLQEFPQAIYFPPNMTGKILGMDETGLFYMPTKCRRDVMKICKLHIHMHGCNQTRKSGGVDWINKSGFLEMAESNNIILVFPQTIATEDNINGCWDTWGKIDENYANRNGSQIKALKRMWDGIIGGKRLPVQDVKQGASTGRMTLSILFVILLSHLL